MNGCEHQRAYYKDYLVGGPLERRCQDCNELLPSKPTIADLERQLKETQEREKIMVEMFEGRGYSVVEIVTANIICLRRERDEAQGKIEKYERFLRKLRDLIYRAPELFPTNEIATYAHQLGAEAGNILCGIDK